MLKTSVLLGLGLLVLSASALYTIASRTQRLQRVVTTRERLVEQTLTDVRVLRAERAYLSRPERIAPLAKALGLAAPTVLPHVANRLDAAKP